VFVGACFGSLDIFQGLRREGERTVVPDWCRRSNGIQQDLSLLFFSSLEAHLDRRLSVFIAVCAKENIGSRVFVGEDSPKERDSLVLRQEESSVLVLFLNEGYWCW